MSMTTAELLKQLDDFAAKQDKAAPGPWIWDEPSNWRGMDARVCNKEYHPIAQVQISGWPRKMAIPNAKVIAASRTVPAAEAAARIRQMLEMLRKHHYFCCGGFTYCVCCGKEKEDGCSGDCRLAAILAGRGDADSGGAQ